MAHEPYVKRETLSCDRQKRPHRRGNIYCEWRSKESMSYTNMVPIFHTPTKVWVYQSVCRVLTTISILRLLHKDELYNLPFYMNVILAKCGGIARQLGRKKWLVKQVGGRISQITEPKNLEEQALVSSGRGCVYEKLIKGYAGSSGGRDCKELPAFIIKRLPFRFTYDK